MSRVANDTQPSRETNISIRTLCVYICVVKTSSLVRPALYIAKTISMERLLWGIQLVYVVVCTYVRACSAHVRDCSQYSHVHVRT